MAFLHDRLRSVRNPRQPKGQTIMSQATVKKAIEAVKGLLEVLPEAEAAEVVQAFSFESHRRIAFDQVSAATNTGRTRLESMLAQSAMIGAPARDGKVDISLLDQKMTERGWTAGKRIDFKQKLKAVGGLRGYDAMSTEA
jgi:hypothetical protein